jgi:hypothetical protein
VCRFGAIRSLVGVIAAGLLLVCITSSADAASPPTLRLTGGAYHNEQFINLSVGPNHYFKPYSSVKILECADRGGKKSNLPTSSLTCDGNTIQGNTVLVNKNGSFSERGYQLFVLPNKSQLGESTDNRPVCNQREACVLYIGENQEIFTWPKIFSRPFTIQASRKHR